MKFKGRLFGRKPSTEKSKEKDQSTDVPSEVTVDSSELPNETEPPFRPTIEARDEEDRAIVPEILAEIPSGDEKGGKSQFLSNIEDKPSTSASTYKKQAIIKPRVRELHRAKGVDQSETERDDSDDESEEEVQIDTQPQGVPPAPVTARPSQKSRVHIKEDEPNTPSPEIQEPDEFGEDMGEMDWAKRVFYMSAERVFPGFRRSSQTRRIGRNLCSTTSRSSLILGMLLVGSYYFNFPWGIGWLCLIGLRLPTLKKVHGGLICGCSILYFAINFLRINAGVHGNSMDDAQQLGVYWMMSALVQLPLITFFLVTDFFSPVFIPFVTIMDTISAILLSAELIFGFAHLNSIISNELRVLRQAQETWKLTNRKTRLPNREGGISLGEQIGRLESKTDDDSLASASDSSVDSDLEKEVTKTATRVVSAST